MQDEDYFLTVCRYLERNAWRASFLQRAEQCWWSSVWRWHDRRHVGQLDAFGIAGAYRKRHWSDAAITGKQVTVSSKEVPAPVAVRYVWAMNPSQRNLLYNKEGLPASPFRTDTWPLFNPNHLDVGVEKPEKTDEALDAKRNYKDWERPRMTQ